MNPSTCPVCAGRQTIDPGFYREPKDGDTTTCRSCEGTGVVWPKPRLRGQTEIMAMLDDYQSFGGDFVVGVDWGMGQSHAAWTVARQNSDGQVMILDTGITRETDFTVRIDPRATCHPERRATLDYLDRLPEDMPIMLLTPQSTAEINAANLFANEANRHGNDWDASKVSVWVTAAANKVGRMRDYNTSAGYIGLLPPEVSPRLAGLPVSEGDE